MRNQLIMLATALIILIAVALALHGTVFADGNGCGCGYTSGGGGITATHSGSTGGQTQTVTNTSSSGSSNNGGHTANASSSKQSATSSGVVDIPCKGVEIEASGPGRYVTASQMAAHFGCTSTAKRRGGGGSTTTTTVFYICNNVIVSSADITCDTQWNLSAHVEFPGIPIDTRPYPATLNRWPTVLRVDELQTSTGSASLGYIPAGGGSPTSPRPGDWKNIVLTLTLSPKTTVPPQVYLENIGWIILPVGQLYTFQWSLPSHPAAGGGPTAGAVGQLQELAQDTPLYTNYARAPYLLTCQLLWLQYDQVCEAGPDTDGSYNCNNFTGHKAYTWVQHSRGPNEVPPTEVKNLPPAEAADTNGDGVPDAYWDLGVVIRRMNDANSISDPVYAHSYSWGSVFYWAAREAQGEITYP